MKCDSCNAAPATHSDDDYGLNLCRGCKIDLIEQRIMDVEMKAAMDVRALKKKLRRLQSYDTRRAKARRHKTVRRSACSRIAMVGRNERKFTRVIDDGVLKEWVAIGWIDIRKATKSDRSRYPKVV